MVVELDQELESALRAKADIEGVAPEVLARNVLREQLLASPLSPRDDWERELLAAARPWGVSYSDVALSSEGLYD